jgi:hypothetical protein
MMPATYLTEKQAKEVCEAFDVCYSEGQGAGGSILSWIKQHYPHLLKDYWWSKHVQENPTEDQRG